MSQNSPRSGLLVRVAKSIFVLLYKGAHTCRNRAEFCALIVCEIYAFKQG